MAIYSPSARGNARCRIANIGIQRLRNRGNPTPRLGHAYNRKRRDRAARLESASQSRRFELQLFLFCAAGPASRAPRSRHDDPARQRATPAGGDTRRAPGRHPSAVQQPQQPCSVRIHFEPGKSTDTLPPATGVKGVSPVSAAHDAKRTADAAATQELVGGPNDAEFDVNRLAAAGTPPKGDAADRATGGRVVARRCGGA